MVKVVGNEANGGGRGRGGGNIDSRKYRDRKLIESYKELNVEIRVLKKKKIN